MGSDNRLTTAPDAALRPFREEDIDGVLRSWERATRLAHPFMSDEFLATQRKAIREIYIPNTITDVALADREVVGFISVMGNEIGAIFVDPACHGMKIGFRLMNLAAARHDELEVEVFEKNAAGRAFYDRYGFSEISRSEFEPLGETVIRMRYTKK